MLKTIQKSGKTEEEAIAHALEELGLTRDDVNVEIVERAKTGFLGIRATPAVVNVSYEVIEEKSDVIRAFLEGLLERFGVQAQIDVSEPVDGTVSVVLSGADPGTLIGRRGETLDAIQHLTNYAVNRGGSRMRVNVDTENYRQRRGDTLETLATKTAAKVIKYRRNFTLDPMNAYERHIIHTTLQENEQVSTRSVGSEPNRRVVVAFGKDGEARVSDNRSGSSRGGSSRPRPPRREAAPHSSAPAPARAPEKPAEPVSRPLSDYTEASESSNYKEWN